MIRLYHRRFLHQSNRCFFQGGSYSVADLAASIQEVTKTEPGASAKNSAQPAAAVAAQQETKTTWKMPKSSTSRKLFIPTKNASLDEKQTPCANYRQHFDILDMVKTELPSLKPSDPQYQVLCHMVDSLSLNPTYNIRQKKQMLSLAMQFLRGDKMDLSVQELKGTQQFTIRRPT